MKASWNGVTLAQSDATVVVEGNHYFPASVVNMNYLQPSETKTFCPWKGIASYYTINAGGGVNKDAVWYYAEPKQAAAHIKGYVAFWRGVEVTD